MRESDKLIVLLGSDRFFSFQNVYEARALGLENAVVWTSPGHHVNLDGTLTWQSVRNASNEGTFGDFEVTADPIAHTSSPSYRRQGAPLLRRAAPPGGTSYLKLTGEI